jgi:hypothetical protein
MNRIAAAIIIIAFVFISITVTEAQPSVGVKTGYWVE